VEFQCRSCSKPGPVAAFPLSKSLANPSVTRCYMVFWSLRAFIADARGSKYRFISERREARFRFEEIAAREERGRYVTRPSLGEKPDRFARRVRASSSEPGIKNYPATGGLKLRPVWFKRLAGSAP
jgi:hypothetical protein